jgi:hypothetical protein
MSDLYTVGVEHKALNRVGAPSLAERPQVAVDPIRGAPPPARLGGWLGRAARPPTGSAFRPAGRGSRCPQALSGMRVGLSPLTLLAGASRWTSSRWTSGGPRTRALVPSLASVQAQGPKLPRCANTPPRRATARADGPLGHMARVPFDHLVKRGRAREREFAVSLTYIPSMRGPATHTTPILDRRGHVSWV